jgi:hypothetical protein
LTTADGRRNVGLDPAAATGPVRRSRLALILQPRGEKDQGPQGVIHGDQQQRQHQALQPRGGGPALVQGRVGYGGAARPASGIPEEMVYQGYQVGPCGTC